MADRITIGVTSFNAITTIERAIDSALAQDWPDIEVVVVDDCSTDGSWPMLQKRAAEDDRIRVFRHGENTGVAGARQTILENASGEFLAYVDDDDDSLPDRLTAQVARITSYEKLAKTDLVFCYSDRAVVKAGHNEPDHIGLGIGRGVREPHGPMVADFVLAIDAAPGFSWGMMGSCTLMARREAYIRVGGFDAAFRRCGELDLAIRAAQLGAHFVSVPRPLITQYKTPGEEKAGTKPLQYMLLLREKHRDYLDRNGLYLSSILFARASFCKSTDQKLKGVAYRLLAYALAPHLITKFLYRRLGRGK